MKVRFFAVFAALLFAGLVSLRAADQDFTLINQSGFEIHSVFLAPHGTEDWQEDVLARATLGTGEFADIKFSREAKAKLWDLKVTDKDGQGYLWESIHLLEVSKVTINFKDGAATATSE